MCIFIYLLFVCVSPFGAYNELELELELDWYICNLIGDLKIEITKVLGPRNAPCFTRGGAAGHETNLTVLCSPYIIPHVYAFLSHVILM